MQSQGHNDFVSLRVHITNQQACTTANTSGWNTLTNPLRLSDSATLCVSVLVGFMSASQFAVHGRTFRNALSISSLLTEENIPDINIAIEYAATFTPLLSCRMKQLI